MKKFLIIIALCFIPVSFLLTGCGHKHQQQVGWYSNSTHHWAECTGENCDKKFGLEEHNYIDTYDKDTISTCTEKGRDYKKCMVCSYETFTEKPLRDHFYVEGSCSCGAIEGTFCKEEDWNNLFIGDYLNNVTIEQKMYLYSKTPQNGTNPLLKSETTRFMLCSEEAIYIRTTSNSVFHVNKNNCWYGVSNVDNTWYGIIETETEAKENSFTNNIGVDFINQYNLFNYNTTDKYFYGNNFMLNGETVDTVKVCIENGKLSKIEYRVNSTHEYTLITIEFKNYGTTVVDIPDFMLAG